MIQWWQILLLTLYSAYQILDELTINSSAGSPVFAGFITGLVMGDLKTGLFIGGSLQLVVLGVGTFGGASRIDATSGAVLATAFSVATGMKSELAISAIAVPVAALLVYTDVLGRFSTTYFAHRIDAAVEKFLALWLGGDAVKAFSDWLANNAQWIADGLILAGKMLPGVGFAILLRYLPVKKNLHYLGLGFAITAMLKVVFDYISTLAAASGAVKQIATALGGAKFEGLPMIGIAIIGFALATINYKNATNKQVVTVAAEQSESGEIDDDEL